MIKPINLEALTKWVGAIPDDVKRDITSIAPMLERLGYAPHAYPPNYGEADKFVAENTKLIKNNEDYWRRRSQEIILMSKAQRNVTRASNYQPKPAEGYIQKDTDSVDGAKNEGGATVNDDHKDTEGDHKDIQDAR